MELIIKPNEKELAILSEVSEITGIDYDGKEWGENLTYEVLINALKDMIHEYRNKEEQIENLQQDGDKEPDYYDEIKNYNMFGC